MLTLLTLLASALAFEHCAKRTFDRCELFMGDEYESVYANGDGPWSGKKFTLTVAQDLFVITASEHATAWSHVEVDFLRSELNITDHFAAPTQFGCDENQSGVYTFKWADKNCRVLTLTRVREPCNKRKELWRSEVTLLKKPCRGPADGVCSIQERTVWSGQRKYGTRSWFVFGGNDAYVETVIDNGERHQLFGRVSINDKSTRSISTSSSTSSELTFDDSLIAFTEYASYPAGKQCKLTEQTGFYRVRGLELTSDELTAGTYERLHGVKIHHRLRARAVDWSADSSSSSSSSSDESSDESSSSSSSLSTTIVDEADSVTSVSSSTYNERQYHRSSSNDECGVIEFESHKFSEDLCTYRKARLTKRGIVAVDSCRGGVPPECTCESSDCADKK